MKLPVPVRIKIAEFAAKFPIPPTDDQRREWTHKVCQQIVFSFPGQGYAHKSAGPGRPHSSDVLAQSTVAGLIGWDLIDGTTGALVADPDSIDLSGQMIELVEPIDHVGGTIPSEPPPTTDPEFTPWATAEQLAKHDAEIKAALGQAVAAVATLPAILQAQVQALTFDGEVRVFGQTIRFTLRPRVNA